MRVPNPAPLIAHYRHAGERVADLVVHTAGITTALLGGGALLGLAIWQGGAGRISAVSIYWACWAAMLLASAIYNYAVHPGPRQVLRRLDHAAIFLMIAGSYTPFTTQRFEGAWAVGMTAAVWSIALAGAAAKLFLPGLSNRIWIAIYVLLGWIVLVAIGPLLDGVSLPALILLIVGGLVYTAGVAFYVWKQLPYRRVIWHGFVVAASGVHYAAVMVGVVFAQPLQ